MLTLCLVWSKLYLTSRSIFKRAPAVRGKHGMIMHSHPVPPRRLRAQRAPRLPPQERKKKRSRSRRRSRSRSAKRRSRSTRPLRQRQTERSLPDALASAVSRRRPPPKLVAGVVTASPQIDAALASLVGLSVGSPTRPGGWRNTVGNLIEIRWPKKPIAGVNLLVYA